MTDFITDANGNVASISYWGSVEKAKKSLESLINCINCENCTNCANSTNCRNCTNCWNCADCTNCTNCTNCWNCADCTGCTDCANCRNCTNSTNCRNCADCTGCTDCANCRNCTNCWNCADCTGCTDCANCTNCANSTNCRNIKDLFANKEITSPTPKIENIHQNIAKAVEDENSFDMSEWHSECGTSHCRAGWVVTLAGEEGSALEFETNTAFAAWQIYKKSDPKMKMPDFYTTTEKALADIKRMAEIEKLNEGQAQ